ncbi:MAG: M23 family metallopeptidase [Pyrinomonadaceae bacterium]
MARTPAANHKIRLFLAIIVAASIAGCEKPSYRPQPDQTSSAARETPTTSETLLVQQTPPPAPTAESSAIVVIPDLIVPVAGVRPEELQDTFSDARSESRVHNAIDIMAAQGTPVLAAADGRITKLLQSERGGITIYQLSIDERIVYYYAHLDRYEANLAEGQFAKQGSVIGYVGDTGNAGSGNYHLHFSVWIISDPKRYWEGENLNPYSLFKR